MNKRSSNAPRVPVLSDYRGRFVTPSHPRNGELSESLRGFDHPDLEGTLPRPAPPPAFPTFLQLVEDSIKGEASEPPRDPGLFVQLLRGRADVLLEDAQYEKSKYDEPTRALLEEMYIGRKNLENLTPEERTLLDVATAALFSRTEINHGLTREQINPKAPKPKDPAEVFAEPEATSPAGEDGLPAFWWLKES
jgi:hypothetical protein